MKILMVCLGNICRSPLADGLLRKKVADHQLDVVVDSAGTSSYHIGNAPDKRMILTANHRGVAIESLKARAFTKADFTDFDHIYVMDKSNLEDVLELAENESDRSKVSLILNEINPLSDAEVPDPYFGGQDGFAQVYDMLNEATDCIIEKIKK
jgi:protein-tyrosine phosphatase